MFSFFKKKSKIVPVEKILYRDVSAAWWVTQEFRKEGNEWKLFFQYESFYTPKYPSPGCSLDYTFYDDFAIALLDCIERNSNMTSNSSRRPGEYRYLVYLTNGHGQILRSKSREFTASSTMKRDSA